MPMEKNTSQRELLASVEERFNGFGLVKKLAENLIRQNYEPVNIVYKPVSKINKLLLYNIDEKCVPSSFWQKQCFYNCQ